MYISIEVTHHTNLLRACGRTCFGEIKDKFYHTAICSVILYGSECWTLKE